MLNIENLKTDVYLECEYAIQQFVPTVCISITADGSLRVTVNKDEHGNVILSSTISDNTPYPYGTTINDIVSKWENLLKNSGTCIKEGWYELIIEFDGSGEPYMSDYFDLSIQGLLNRNIYICARYITSDPEDSKAVYFYTWEGDDKGHYVEFIYNKYYILQTVYYEYERIQTAPGEYSENLITHKAGYIYDETTGTFGWDDQYFINYNYFAPGSYKINDDDPTKLDYAKLSNIPISSMMGSPYPNTQFICYLIFNQAVVESLKDSSGNSLGIMSINDIVSQNVYARVTNYYNEGGKLYADVEFVGVGSLDGVTVQKIEVLSTSTEIDQNLYVLQGYSSIKFTIETNEEIEGSGNYKNDNFVLDSTSNNLKIHEDYLESVTFFDINNSQVVYYSPNNGDFVNVVVLSPAQYQAYLYAKSVYSLDTTALSSVLSSYSGSVEVHSLKPDIAGIETTFDEYGYYTITNMNDGYYAFMFYYNHNAPNSIVAICDTYIKNDNGVLKYYPTDNNLAFTNSSVSASVGFDESNVNIPDPTKTYVVVSTNAMFTTFTDYNKVQYNANNLKLVMLTPEMLQTYISQYYVTLNREGSLQYILNNFGGSNAVVQIGKSSMISNNAYIIAYFENGEGTVVNVAPNYVYINNILHSATIIYDQDIMFINDYTEDNIARDIENNKFDITIDTSKMTTTKYDHSTGIQYNISNYDLNFIAFNGAQFKKFTDYISNKFMTVTAALNLILNAHNGEDIITYTSRAKLLASSVTIIGLDESTHYYIMAFYTNKTGDNAENISLATSANILYVYDDNDTFSSSISTLSNNFGFTIASVNIDEATANVSFNTDMMNSIYENYKTGESLNVKTIKYLQVSKDELNMIYEYYYNGLEIGSRNYTDITFEQAVSLMMYYYRPQQNGIQISELLDALDGTHDLDYIFNNTKLEIPVYSDSQNLAVNGSDLENGQSKTSKYYFIAINFTDEDAVPNKVSNNFVEFTMTIRKDNSGNSVVESLDANVIDFINLFNSLS